MPKGIRKCPLIPFVVATLSVCPAFARANVTAQWNVNGNGVWDDPLNWAGNAVPAGPGDLAIFDSALIDPAGATVSLNGDRTIGGIAFNNTAGSYTIAPGTGGTLLLQGATIGILTPTINVISGKHRIDAPISSTSLTINLTGSVAGDTRLILNQSAQTSGTIFLNGSGSGFATLELAGSKSSLTSTNAILGSTTGTTRLLLNGGNLVTTRTSPSVASLLVGSASAGESYVNVQSGTLSVNGELWLGDRSTSSSFAAFTQTGGTVTVGSFFVVGNSNDRAVLNVKGGSMLFQSLPLTIGAGAGFSSGNAVGVVNLSGGTLTSKASGAGIYIGEIGTGVLNVSGAAFVDLSKIQYGGTFDNKKHVGILNLLGGTLSTTGLFTPESITSSIFSFNFHGGVLQISQSTTSFVQSAAIPLYVYPQGAFIDVGTNSASIGQLLAPTGNGVSAIDVTSASGYLDTPVVQITAAPGDTGFGATAVANIDANGNLTGITITNPGIGYATAPGVILTGGGGTPVTVGSVTLSPNSSGAVTKFGSGTLTLAGNGTFAGGLNVASGTLAANSTSAFGTGAVNIALNATVRFQSGGIVKPILTGNGSVSIASGTTLNLTDASLASFEGNFTGSGDLLISALGILPLAGSNRFSGVYLASGALELDSPNAIGFASIHFNGGILRFSAANTADYSGNFAPGNFAIDTNGQTVAFAGHLNNFGAGSLTKLGQGTLILAASGNCGTTNINAGVLQLNNLAEIGPGDIHFGGPGTLALNRDADSVIPLAITGSAGTVSQLTNSLTLLGNNTWTGGLSIAPGATVQVGSGGTAGTLDSAAVLNNGTFAINRAENLTIAGPITGIGTFAHLGTGTTTLAGNYNSGPINVFAGKLVFAEINAPRQSDHALISTTGLGIATLIDITNHDLMITNNTPTTSNLLINYYWKNGTAALTGNGDPNGPQITSSTATNNTSSFPTFLVAFDLDRLFGNGTTGDGSAIGQNLGAYTDNQPVTQPGTIMVKYGYYADLDFSGKVDAGDINLILGALGQTTPGMADPGLAYLTGDIDYSGKVDAGDINLVLGMLGAGSGGTEGNPLGIRDAQPLDTSPAPPASHIPEPSAVSLLALGSIFLLPRRRTTTVQKNSPPLGRSTGGAGRKE